MYSFLVGLNLAWVSIYVPTLVYASSEGSSKTELLGKLILALASSEGRDYHYIINTNISDTGHPNSVLSTTKPGWLQTIKILYKSA